MTRVLRRIIHNWPLKLAAVGLATLLYGGLVVSQSTRTFPTVIPITPVGQPADSFLLTAPEAVTEIRYFSASGVQPIASDFRATIDLSNIEPGGGPQRVPVQVESIDPRIRVTGVQPQAVTVDLDRLARRTVPVSVPAPIPPTGLTLGDIRIEPMEVEISGPASVIERVVTARADVGIQPSGLDFDQDVEVVPIDELGDRVPQINVEPSAVRVTVPVYSDRETRSLPISPLITGDPAAGFELVNAAVEPKFVTVEGDADQLAELISIDTAPISVNGLSADRTFEATLALPTGVEALGVETVEVAVDVRAVTATRAFEVGFRIVNAEEGLAYDPLLDRVLITVGGSLADLDRLYGSALLADLDVAGLDVGTGSAPVAIDLPAGVALVAASPDSVSVTVTSRAPASPAAVVSPPPAAEGSAPPPSPSPGG